MLKQWLMSWDHKLIAPVVRGERFNKNLGYSGVYWFDNGEWHLLPAKSERAFARILRKHRDIIRTKPIWRGYDENTSKLILHSSLYNQRNNCSYVWAGKVRDIKNEKARI